MAEQGRLKTIKNIAKAYTTPLPVDEKWFQDRLDICNGCEFNSKVADMSKMSLIEKLSFTTKQAVCGGEDHCTACGCCIQRKASVKAEQCGIAKLSPAEKIAKSLEPKWFSLEVNSDTISDVSMENLTPEQGNISIERLSFVYDLGKVSDLMIPFSFSFTREKGFEVKDYAAGCKCSVASHRQINKQTCEFDMQISTETFSKNVKTSRTFNINYYVGNNRTKNVTVVFKITKI